MKRTLTYTALTALLVGACGGLAPGQVGELEQATQANDLAPNGRGNVVKWQKTPEGQAGKGGGGNGISYHGGPVMTGTVNVYYIWYGNWSGNTGTTLLPKLVGDLSGSGYEHINTSYYNGAGQHVSGLMNLAGQTNDNYSQGTSLSDAQIQTIVANHCPTLGNCDTNGLYFVLTSADVNATSGFCTQYCGWHTHGTLSGKDVKYSFVGNPDRCPASCEAQTLSPNGNAGVDGMASIIAHEAEEAISDPDLNAWYDGRGAENADKCAWTFGTESTAANGSKYNFSGTSGTKWLIQQNWVNAAGGYCAMSY